MVFQRPVTFAGTRPDNLREADPRSTTTALRRAARARRPRRRASWSATRASCRAARRSAPAWRARSRRDPRVLLMDEPTSSLDGEAAGGARAARAPARRRRHAGRLGHALRGADAPPRRPRRCCSRTGAWSAARRARRTTALGARRTRSGDDERRDACERQSGDVGALGLAASLMLVAVALAISLRLRLRLERELVVAVLRGFVQLIIVGAALAIVIDPDTPLVWSWLWVAGIVVFAAATVKRRAPAVPGPVLDRARRQRRDRGRRLRRHVRAAGSSPSRAARSCRSPGCSSATR